MRVLVLGASGMAGHVIAIRLQELGHEVDGFARRELSFVKTIVGDARDDRKLAEIVEDGGYDVAVNAIGILNRNADVRKAEATYLNAYLPHRLAEIGGRVGVRIVHMSTDCVFAGNTGPYTEASVPDGTTFYDRSKALGELDDKRNLTLRNSIVGPDMNEGGIGLFNWFMRQEGSIKGFTGAVWTGMTTLELANAMDCAIREGVCGLVNMVPDGSISKMELLELFNEYFRGGSVLIEPDGGLSLDKSLVRTNFECSFRPKPYREQIRDMAEWVGAHKELYPHYGME